MSSGTILRTSVFILASGFTLPLSAYEDPKNDLDGTWEVTKANREGKEAPDVIGHRLTIQGDRFEIRERDKLLFKGTLKVDKTRESLWRFECVHTDGEQKGKTWSGVMRSSGPDLLEVCDNAIDPTKPGPRRLESRPDSGTILLTFKRVPR